MLEIKLEVNLIVNPVILVINAGSSSIKFALFKNNEELSLCYKGSIETHASDACFHIDDQDGKTLYNELTKNYDYQSLINRIFAWIKDLPEEYEIKGVGHRIVHGGNKFVASVVITGDVLQELETLIPLAPLHQGHNLAAIKMITKLYPEMLQVACFDTSFHTTQNNLAKIFAIPQQLTGSGIIRYGFHGLSYEYIASVIEQNIGELGNARVLVAHLGNGASMCAMYQKKSVATSMGFTAIDGLMMGTRTGNLDPGVILYLQQEKGYTLQEIEHMLYNESGLLGVSGISNDVRKLLADDHESAKLALDLFCYRVASEFGRLSVAIGGVDAFIFTAGIGEKSSQIRENVCNYLKFYGLELDSTANLANKTIISAKNSKVIVAVIPTNEELILAKNTQALAK